MRKILFLDIDGVTWGFLTMQPRRSAQRLMPEREFDRPPYVHEFVPDKVSMICDIIEATQCEVVLSSTWRKIFSIEDVNLFLNRACSRWKLDEIKDKTPDLGFMGERGLECIRWVQTNINAHEELLCIAVDDNSDFKHFDGVEFILHQTNGDFGLTAEDRDAIIFKFNEDQSWRLTV